MTDDLGYSPRYLRFVRAHAEAFRSAYLAPSPQTSSHELERLRREFETMPPGHSCTCPRVQHWRSCSPRRCVCPRTTRFHCLECQRVCQIIDQAIPLETTGGRPVISGPVPLLVMLDLAAGYAA